MSDDVAGFDDLDVGDLHRRLSEKWHRYPRDVLPSFVAEMDYPLAPPLRAALEEVARLGDTGYAWPNAELAQSLSGFAAARWGWSPPPDSVRLVPDVMVGVLESLRLLLRAGDGVIVNPPVYPPFFEHIAEAGCTVVESPLARDVDGAYHLDLDGVERAFQGGARAYLLCNPHNPTGTVPSRDHLLRVAELAQRYDAYVISDEIHAPLALAGATHVPYLSAGESAAERGVALVSASKAWNVPGLKCAQLLAVSERMRAHVERMPDAVLYRTGIVGIHASIAAYCDGGAWLDSLLGVLDRNRTLMSDLVLELLPGVRYVPPRATYLAWLDCTALGIDGDLGGFFREHGGVAVLDGQAFGSGGEGFVRLTLGTSRQMLIDIIERMSTALRK